MLQLKDERITNESLRKRFNNIKSLSEIWRCRVLKFIGRVACQNPATLPQKFLSTSIYNKIAVRRSFRKWKDVIVESICMLIPSTSASGKFKYWFGYASDAKKWNAMISVLHTKTYPCYSTKSYPNTHSRNPNHYGMGIPSEQPTSPPTSLHPNHNTQTNESPRIPPLSNNPRSPQSSPTFDFTINKMS